MKLARHKLSQSLTFLVIISLFYNCSCSNQENESKEVETIDIRSVLGNPRQVPLSSVAKAIRYIKLETDESCMIKKVDKLLFADSLIFISNGEALLVFKKNGNFSHQIGGKGKGPGEYLDISDLDYQEKTSQVLIFDHAQQKVIRYALTGELVSEFRTDGYPNRVKFFDNYLIAGYAFPNYTYNENYTLKIIDLEGNDSSKLLPRDPRGINDENFGLVPSTNCVKLIMIDDTITYWETHMNTIYQVTTEGEISEKYYLDYPNFNYQMRAEEYQNFDHSMIRFGNFIESKDYFFLIQGLFEMNVTHIVYNKNKKEVLQLGFDTDDFNLKIQAGFYNDIDGGYPFLPEGSVTDKSLYQIVHPFKLKKAMQKESVKQQKFKNHDKRRELLQLLQNSEELDNPIVMLVDLK